MNNCIGKLSSLLLYVYTSIQFEVYRVWIYLNRFLFQPSTPLTSSSKCDTTIAVIGDSLGYGLGDSFFTVESAGVGYSLHDQIQLESSIRTKWNIVNYSSCKSTSNYWLPGSNNGDRCNVGKTLSLFDKHKKRFQNAPIIIVFMGTQDILLEQEGLPDSALLRNMEGAVYPKEEIASVVSNILTICIELQSMKKHVVVIDLSTEGFPHSGRGNIRRINQQLKQVIHTQNSLLAESSSSYRHKIQVISLGNNHRIMQRQQETHCHFDALHLNRKGYELLSQCIFQNGLKEMIVNIEWIKWKVLLKNQ